MTLSATSKLPDVSGSRQKRIIQRNLWVGAPVGHWGYCNVNIWPLNVA